MTKSISILLAAILAGAACSAIASASTASVFKSEDSYIVIAQAEAVDEYAHYLQRMMMHDKDMLPALDTNKDGEISDAEFAEAYHRVFANFDKNGDGMLEKSELDNAEMKAKK